VAQIDETLLEIEELSYEIHGEGETKRAERVRMRQE
jgi:hypothetical protein